MPGFFLSLPLFSGSGFKSSKTLLLSVFLVLGEPGLPHCPCSHPCQYFSGSSSGTGSGLFWFLIIFEVVWKSSTSFFPPFFFLLQKRVTQLTSHQLDVCFGTFQRLSPSIPSPSRMTRSQHLSGQNLSGASYLHDVAPATQAHPAACSGHSASATKCSLLPPLSSYRGLCVLSLALAQSQSPERRSLIVTCQRASPGPCGHHPCPIFPNCHLPVVCLSH